MTERFLVLGVGRSGTGYAASLLSGLGLRFGHEAVHDWQADSGEDHRWEGWDGDASLAAWTGIASGGPCRVAVVLRDPRLVVASLLGSYFFADECPCHPPGAHASAPYRMWMHERFPELADEGTEMGRAACYVAMSLQAILSACSHPNVADVMTFDIAELAEPVHVSRLARFFGVEATDGQAREAIDAAHRNDHPGHPTRVELLDALLDSDWQP